MRLRTGFFVLLLAAMCSTVAWAQVDLDEFPTGTTEMSWRLAGEGIPPEQTIGLTVSRENDEYDLRLSVSARGAADELELLGFLGSALGVQAPGAEVDLSVLSTLLRRPGRLEVGAEYHLPGGRLFTVRERTEIAGVESLIGEYREPGAARVVEIGISLDDPVYFLPLIRVTRNGELELEMELVEYIRP